MDNVEFRKQSEMPSTPGWYYGRAGGADIAPVQVEESEYGLVALHGELCYGLELFDWFGPVARVREASTGYRQGEGSR